MSDVPASVTTSPLQALGATVVRPQLTWRSLLSIGLPTAIFLLALFLAELVVLYQSNCDGDTTPKNVLTLFAVYDIICLFFVPTMLTRAVTTETWSTQALNLRFSLLTLCHAMLFIMSTGIFVSMQTECPQAGIDKMFLAEIVVRLLQLLCIPIFWYESREDFPSLFTRTKRTQQAYDVLAGAEDKEEVVFSHELDADDGQHLL